MKRPLFVFLLFALCVILVPTLVAAGGDAKAGKAVYNKKCASCHGAGGEGKPTLAKALKVEIRDFASKEVQAKTDDQLKKDTVEGVGKMKGVTGLKDQEVADLIAFIRSLKK
ncbi:MAG: cytochrome c [Acidobacteria bacterium]|nr:cytochrome c [Acidobacteriota bacterium]